MDPKDISAKQAAEKNESPGKSSENIEPVQKPSGERPKEIGGPKGLEPTRYGDWEKRGRCVDF
jgi:hypothetical protein